MERGERLVWTFEGLERPVYPRQKGKTVNYKKEKRICDLFDEGLRPSQIAKKLRLNTSIVSVYLIKNGRRTYLK